MKEPTIYIPWFGNSDDAIYKNYLGEEGRIIQENLKLIEPKQISAMIQKYWEDKVFLKLQKHYPDMNRSEFDKNIQKLDSFKWLTRDINTTISLTSKEIINELNDNTDKKVRIIWHSQGWLVLMQSIIKNPHLINQFSQIELLAPVATFKIGRNFHQWSKWYLNPKKIIVRKEYLSSLDKEDDLLYNFLDILKDNDYTGSIKLILGDQDNVVKIEDFNLNQISNLYPFVKIEVKHGDHYLGYK